MADQIKELIEKIQQEGVQAAQAKAKDIESGAERKAQELIAQAKKDAEKIIAQAQDEVKRMRQSGKVALEQAGRDLLLNLRAEIKATLKRVILLNVRAALAPAELAKIIASLVKNLSGQEKGEIIVTLNKKDLAKIEQGFLTKFKEEIKKGLTLESSEDIQGGLIISYDGGKSHFDFTDERLADYLSLHLKGQLSKILR